MPKLLLKLAAVAGLLLLACSAQANPFLPGVQNLDFLNYTGAAPKAAFTSVNPVGWVGGGGLIFLNSPGAPGCSTCADGSTYLTTYGPFPNPPIPGNYVEADGNPDYEGSFSQTITGLTPGQTYTLSFYQAGGQQAGFGNGLPTTEKWIVSLGTAGLSLCANCGPVDPVYGQTSTYYSTDPNASITSSALMTTPSGGVTPWEYVSVDLTADASTQLLSFLAWGDNGSTINLPPIVFLSGVNSPNVLTNVPEPATLALFGLGILGVAASRMRRHGNKKNAAV